MPEGPMPSEFVIPSEGLLSSRYFISGMVITPSVASLVGGVRRRSEALGTELELCFEAEAFPAPFALRCCKVGCRLALPSWQFVSTPSPAPFHFHSCDGHHTRYVSFFTQQSGCGPRYYA